MFVNYKKNDMWYYVEKNIRYIVVVNDFYQLLKIAFRTRYGPEGRGFESLMLRHEDTAISSVFCFLI